MIDSLVAAAPLHSRIVVVGVCMGADAFRPALAVNKELDLRFVVGYSPLEFRDSLHALAKGTIDASPIVTGRVGLSAVPTAFTALANPGTHGRNSTARHLSVGGSAAHIARNSLILARSFRCRPTGGVSVLHW
jgi:hypothetical protein